MQVEDTSKASYYKNRVDSTSNDFNGFLQQVGRTYLGEPISESEFKIIVNLIIETLDVAKEDVLLDLGCANGLLTNEVAKYAKFVTGFDINQDLLSVANENHKRNNINYILSDIMDIDFRKYNAKKLYMFAVVQYLEHKMLKELLQKMSNQMESFTLFIGDMLDQEKKLNFYHTKERKKFLFTELIENKKYHLGYWWHREHIVQLCEDLDLNVEIKDQNPDFQTSKYRFDVLISK